MIVKVVGWIIRPSVADRHRFRHFGTEHDYGVAINIGLGPDPFLIFTGDGKSLKLG